MTVQEAERCYSMVEAVMNRMYQEGKLYEESDSSILRITEKTFKEVQRSLQYYFQSYIRKIGVENE